MTADIRKHIERTVRDMARREAAILMGAADRLPSLTVRSLPCACGASAEGIADGLDPSRTGQIRDLGTGTGVEAEDDAGLPVLTRLACERFDSRSLLPVAVMLLRAPHRQVRLCTRAVALSGMLDGRLRPPRERALPRSPDPGSLLLMLRRLNDDEARWSDTPGPVRPGDPARTVPVATHAVPPAPVGDAVFLGPHWDMPLLGDLNEVYLRHRMDAVLKAL